MHRFWHSQVGLAGLMHKSLLSPMAKLPKSPIAALKNGLSILQKNIKARLSRKEKVSIADEEWLDNEANVVEEEMVIEKLEKASDYELAFERLNSKENEVVKKLMELAEGEVKTVSKKRKAPVDPKPATKKTTKDTELKFAPGQRAKLAQKITVLEWYRNNGKNQTQTAAHFGLVQGTLSRWVAKMDFLQN
ncbi:hypothetical protein D9758_015425 [Tetrapyrgos nigripes]|uniref:Insertion element IS150 protein InsJ-like helix-turn-helix domain-containing protein n=1 Tax=Tetrapyrgos nigripes TaxID=182062 RepID=A0A8H5CLD8_9AGAR|nr:hypothetical protein D9758_015425 [Tetrapyrgos nigripes]